MAIQVNLRLHEDLYERVEDARGGRSRNGFVVRALEAALSGSPSVAAPPDERSPGAGAAAPSSAASPRTSVGVNQAIRASAEGGPCRNCKAGIVRFGKCSNCGTAGHA